MSEPISLALPYPPSANKIWRAVNGRNIKSAEYRSWLDAGHRSILAQRPGRVTGAYRLSLVVNRTDRRHRDLSNVIKPLEDLLQAAGVVRDDCDCIHLMVCWGEGEPSRDAQVFAQITEAQP